MIPALGYIRVSSYLGRDKDSALTEDIQLQKIRDWCKAVDLDLVDVLRDTASGKTQQRPGFQTLMQRLERGEAGAVVVYRMSRFGRDMLDTIATIRDLRKKGVQFHSASERLDLDSAHGRLVFHVLAGFDEFERELRGEYWGETRAKVLTERGIHLGRTPLGYVKVKGQALIPDPALAPHIRGAYEMRAAGTPVAEIVDMLNRDAPRPDGWWTHTQVARMLCLRIYLGEVKQGDLVVTDAHDPIVPVDVWDAAQGVGTPRQRRAASAAFPLAGKIRCAGCGFPMTGWAQPRHRVDGSVDRVRVYRCVRARKGGKCATRAVINSNAVESLVCEQVEPFARRTLADVERHAAANADLEQVQAEVQALDDRLRRLNGDLRETLDSDLWQEMVMDLAGARRDKMAERDALAERLGVQTTTVAYDDLDERERWEVLLRGVDAVIVRKALSRQQPASERVSVYELGTVAHLLPSAANGFALRPFDFDAAGV